MRITPEQAERMGLVRNSSGDWTQGRTGKPALSPASGGRSKAVELEGDLHEDILAYCRARGWRCVHSRMDRPATCEVGTPDFAIVMPDGVTLWVEAKARHGKPTVEQLAWLAALHRLGHVCGVVRSMDEFQELVRTAERRTGMGQGAFEGGAEGDDSGNGPRRAYEANRRPDA